MLDPLGFIHFILPYCVLFSILFQQPYCTDKRIENLAKLRIVFYFPPESAMQLFLVTAETQFLFYNSSVSVQEISELTQSGRNTYKFQDSISLFGSKYQV